MVRPLRGVNALVVRPLKKHFFAASPTLSVCNIFQMSLKLKVRCWSFILFIKNNLCFWNILCIFSFKYPIPMIFTSYLNNNVVGFFISLLWCSISMPYIRFLQEKVKRKITGQGNLFPFWLSPSLSGFLSFFLSYLFIFFPLFLYLHPFFLY